MTTKEILHRIVDELSDDDAAAALALLQSQLTDDQPTNELPAFFGMLDSDNPDLAEHSANILRTELGRS